MDMLREVITNSQVVPQCTVLIQLGAGKFTPHCSLELRKMPRNLAQIAYISTVLVNLVLRPQNRDIL